MAEWLVPPVVGVFDTAVVERLRALNLFLRALKPNGREEDAQLDTHTQTYMHVFPLLFFCLVFRTATTNHPPCSSDPNLTFLLFFPRAPSCSLFC